jgi:two-component system, NarL family, response regulator DevR
VRRSFLAERLTKEGSMRPRIRVFLLAGHRLLREALGRTLRKRPELLVVGESPALPDVAGLVVQSGADVLLLDALSGLSANLRPLRDLHELCPDAKILLIGMEEDEQTFLKAVELGVVGYLFEDASAMDVVAAIRAVAAGEAVCPSRLNMSLFRTIARGKSFNTDVNVKADLRLTRREQELVPLIARGLTNREIASQLNLSEQTVKNHVHRMLRKVGVEDRLSVVEAVMS